METQEIDTNKRYWGFAWTDHEVGGGFNDWAKSSSNIKELKEFLIIHCREYWHDHAHIFDSKTQNIITIDVHIEFLSRRFE